MLSLEGVSASPGVAIGKAFLFQKEDIDVPSHTISDADVEREIEYFEFMLKQTTNELEEIRKRTEIEMSGSHAELFKAHKLLLRDPMFVDAVVNEIRLDKSNAALAVKRVTTNLIEQFSKIDNEYMKGRVSDIRDIGRRVIQNLLGRSKTDLSNLMEQVIVIAHDLSPSDTALMNKEMVIGFATDVGSKTSHTAIMARALQIPAVVGLGFITSKVKNGDLVIIDGTHGKVLVNPENNVFQEYLIEQSKFLEFEQSLECLKDLPVITIDNHKIELACNIEVPEEIDYVAKYGANGIGLYRTEYLYIRKKEMPSEEEQYLAYKEAAEKVAPESVIIRTLDLGGDKFASYLEFTDDVSSMMGLRAIRLCLQRPDIFFPQLRAILRASVHGKIKIMFPMVSSIEELRSAKEKFNEAKEQLTREGIPFDPNLEVGVMIEVPSAAMTADILAKEADFFSIGTNDLIQYTIAVHRVNPEVTYLYEPLNPAVLRLIQHVVDIAHKNNIWVGICGEMAGDPLAIPLLLGMGLDELSVSPSSIPEIKKIIRSLSIEESIRIKNFAMTLTTARDIERYVYGEAMERYPDVLIWSNHQFCKQ
ncbi:MAG: phosphoenolpyruvate--protein phosphotransferase [bacterium]